VNANPDEEAQMYAFTLQVAYETLRTSRYRLWYKFSMASGPVFSAVERLDFACEKISGLQATVKSILPVAQTSKVVQKREDASR